MNIGDYYAKAFSEGLKLVGSVEKLDLKANRLTDLSSAAILEAV